MMLYSLSIHSSNRYAYAFRDRGFGGYDRTPCPSCGREIATPLPRTAPRAYEVEGGAKYPDFLAFTGVPVGDFLCSARVIDLLREAGISGLGEIESVPVFRVKGAKTEPVSEPVYQLAPIIGRVELDLPAMKLKKKNLCPACGRFAWSRERLYTIPAALDMDTWSGHDLCRVGDFPAMTVCSERVVEVIRKHKLTGAELGPIADMFRAF